jgi:hypothetical protein
VLANGSECPYAAQSVSTTGKIATGRRARGSLCRGDQRGSPDRSPPRPAPGLSELAFHPGYGDDLASTYRHERVLELRALCDARLRRVLAEERIELKSFRDLPSSPSVLTDERSAARRAKP